MSHGWGMWKILLGVGVVIGVLSADQVGAALSLDSAFTVSQSYTNNLFYQDTNRKTDMGTFLGPNITLLYDNPDIVIGATYFGRVALFINNPNANTYIQNANIILDLPFLTRQFRGLTVTINEAMRFTPQLDAFSFSGGVDPLTDGSFGNRGGGRAGGGGFGGVGGSSSGVNGGAGGGNTPGGPLGGQGGILGSQGGGTQGVFTSRANAFVNHAGITLAYAWSPRAQPTLQYTNQYRHFFSSGFQDSIRHGVRLSLPYGVNQQTTVTPSYSYSQSDFIGTSTQTTSGDKSISHQPSLGISHNLTPSLTGSINGGVTFSKQIGAEQSQGGMTQQITNNWKKTFTGGASLVKTYSRGVVGLSARQHIGFGGGLASQSTRTRTVRGHILHALGEKLNAFARLGWAKNDSTNGNAFNATTYAIQAGLGYSFTAWLSGQLSYSHIDQNSTGSAANDLKVDQFFLGLTATADPWFLMR